MGPFAREEAVSSSRIEGSRSTLGDLFRFEMRQLTLPGLAERAQEHDVREVRNYFRALEYATERVATLPLGLRFLRELHAILMEGVRGGHATPGEFRTTQNWIGAPRSTLANATYVPPPVPEMKAALGQLEAYLHAADEHHPLIRLAFLHYQFEAVHPFVDGNGRIGRLLLALVPLHWGLLPHPVLYLSSFLEANRADYYALLLGVSRDGDWRSWVQFILGGVAEQAQDTVARLARVHNLRQAWLERIAGERPSLSLPTLVDSLFRHPLVSVPTVERLTGLTYRAARRNVERLVGLGILRPLAPAKPQVYAAGELLAIVEDGPT
jgi:Fic family protein